MSPVKVAKIAELRHERGMSASDLAREAKTTRQAIWNIENGLHIPNFDLGVRIANALGVNANELAGDDDE